MKMPVNKLQKGMVTSRGIVRCVTQRFSWGKVTHYEVEFYDGKVLDFPTDYEVTVTHVPAKHVTRGMYLMGFGEVTGRNGTMNPEVVRVHFGYRYDRFHVDFLFTLAPVPTKPEAPLDPKKHLLWAIDNKDWAQARAALTELEKSA